MTGRRLAFGLEDAAFVIIPEGLALDVNVPVVRIDPPSGLTADPDRVRAA